MTMTDNDKKDLALAAWVTSVNDWVKVASEILDEKEAWILSAKEKLLILGKKVEALEAGAKEMGERLAALEQIYNKSKQAPCPATDPQYTNCLCKVCSPPKADPGPGFYYCPACGTRQITGSFHYCPGKTYPPEGFGHGSAATPAATYTAPEGGQSIMATPTSPVYGQRGAAPLCGPESAPVPAPPLGGQTEEEIRKAARLAAGKLWTSGFVYRVDY